MSVTPVAVPSRALTIFLSYAPQDQEWFDLLSTHLAPLRHQYPHHWLHSGQVSGSPAIPFIATNLNTADLFILLPSPNYLASQQCVEQELPHALTRSTAGAARLLPIQVRFSSWKTTILGRYQALPRNDVPVNQSPDQDETLTIIVAEIRRVLEDLASQKAPPLSSPSQPTRIYNTPHSYNPFFTNRDDILDRLTSFFTTTPPSPRTIVALKGLAGIGKTQLALKYSYNSTHLYQAILWLNASSRLVFSRDVGTLARQLALPLEDLEDEQQLFDAVKHWLQEHSHWLLVLDQLDELPLLDLIVPRDCHGKVYC